MTELTQTDATRLSKASITTQFAERGDGFEDPIIIIALEIIAVVDEVRHAVPLFDPRDHVLRNVSLPRGARYTSVYLCDCL